MGNHPIILSYSERLIWQNLLQASPTCKPIDCTPPCTHWKVFPLWKLFTSLLKPTHFSCLHFDLTNIGLETESRPSSLSDLALVRNLDTTQHDKKINVFFDQRLTSISHFNTGIQWQAWGNESWLDKTRSQWFTMITNKSMQTICKCRNYMQTTYCDIFCGKSFSCTFTVCELLIFLFWAITAGFNPVSSHLLKVTTSEYQV